MKILTSSDFHLGMKFKNYPEVSEKLIAARFTALSTLVAAANSNHCDLFLLAGDLFDTTSVSKATILQARKILDEFTGKLVAVLPGNHDFYVQGEKDLWDTFIGEGRGNVLVLKERVPVPLSEWGIDACLYPAPCFAKHSDENGIGWIAGATRPSCSFHIGVAHGSVEGISPDMDGRYYPMGRDEIDRLGLDTMFIGHTHVQRALGKLFIPGTPEPDGFDCEHDGAGLLVELEAGKAPKATPVPSGTYTWRHETRTLSVEADVEQLLTDLSQPVYQKRLLKLRLEGRLPAAAFKRVREIEAELRGKCFHLAAFENQVGQIIGTPEIDAVYPGGSFAHDLLTELSRAPEDVGALQTAWDLLHEVRP
jgi:DNA repair exonuclease SbcCD nuclease subunit